LFGAVPDAGARPLAGAGLEEVGPAAGAADVAAGDGLPVAGAAGAEAAGADVAGFELGVDDAAEPGASEVPTEFAAGAAWGAVRPGVGVVDASTFCVVVSGSVGCVGLATLEPFNGVCSTFCGTADKLGGTLAGTVPAEGGDMAGPAGTGEGAAGTIVVGAADSTG